MLLSCWANLSQFMLSILALPCIFIFPYFMGKIILNVIKIFCELKKSSVCIFLSHAFQDSISLYGISWILGVYVTNLLLFFLTIFHLDILSKTFFHIIIFIVLCQLLYNIYKAKHCGFSLRASVKLKLRYCVFSLILVIIASVGTAITRSYFPFPSIVGRTYFLLPWQVQDAYRLTQNGYYVFRRIGDTIFQAIALSMFNVEPLGFLWAAPFALAAMYVLGVFMFVYSLTNNLKFSVLCGLFGFFSLSAGPIRPSFFITLNSNELMRAFFPWLLCLTYNKLKSFDYKFKDVFKVATISGLFYLFSRLSIEFLYGLNITMEDYFFFWLLKIPILMLILPFMVFFLSFLLKNEANRELFYMICLFTIVYLFMHLDESILYTLALLCFILTYKLVDRKYFIFAISFISFIFVGLQWFDVLNIKSANLLSSLLIPKLRLSQPVDIFDIKRGDFKMGYEEITISLMILGCCYLLFSKKREGKLMVTVFLEFLIIFFLPEYQTIRFSSQIFPFMAYILSSAFYFIYKTISKVKNPSTVRWHIKVSKRSIYSILLLASLLIAFIPPLVKPFYSLSYMLSDPHNPYSYRLIANYEYEAAKWIKTNTPSETIIISDYMTSLILSSIGNKYMLFGRGMDGTEAGKLTAHALEIIKFKIFGANSSDEAHYYIRNILPSYIYFNEKFYVNYNGKKMEDFTFIVVFSARTVAWIEKESLRDVTHMRYSRVPQNLLNLFEDPKYFELIYRNSEGYLYIYKVK